MYTGELIEAGVITTFEQAADVIGCGTLAIDLGLDRHEIRARLQFINLFTRHEMKIMARFLNISMEKLQSLLNNKFENGRNFFDN